MTITSITPSGTIENTATIMLSSKELLSQQMNLAAQNLSNADTISFKGLMQSGMEAAYRNPRLSGVMGRGVTVSYVQGAPVKRSMEQGALRQTNNPFDLALNGFGYFVIQADGKQQLTRDGRFRLNSQGKLVTMDGHSVLGSNGEIDVGGYHSVSIMEDGTILGFDQNNAQTVVGTIKLIGVEDEQNDLEYVGQGRFLLVGEEHGVPQDTRVMQGFLEQSNVNPIMESVRLMQILERYRESQNVTDMDDQLKTKTINLRIGMGA